jgi:enoyl-CoA hydratase/carnithine racemase
VRRFEGAKVTAVAYEGYDLLRIEIRDAVLRATIDNPPINLLDLPLIVEFGRLIEELRRDDDIKVVIVDSADEEIFVAHADVTLLEQLPIDDDSLHDRLSDFHALVEAWRTMPKATIAVIEGVARGGGSELVLSFDMRFAALGRAVLAQPEIAAGLVTGGAATQRLPNLVGRARALEILLGGDDIDAATAAQWGYVNRALPADELRPFVDALAVRIASFPAEVIAMFKAVVDAGLPDPLAPLNLEDQAFRRSLGSDEGRRRMRAFLEAGGQTREVELMPFPLL